VAQYGVVPTLPTPVIEETLRTRQPDFWYACAKHDVERRLDELERAHPDLRVTRFRPAILIGRRMENLLGQLLRKGLMPDSGSLPIVWDEDVADAFILALRTGARGAYNLSADDQQQPRELARVAGLRVPKISVGVVRAAEKLLTRLRLIKPGDPGWTMPVKMRLVYSSEKAKRELGWRPKYPTARDVMKHFVEVAPRTLDKRLSALTRMINLSEPVPGRGLESAVHLELTGPNGGDLTLRAQGGKLHISRGAPRPADATVTLKADTLLDLLAGKLDYAGAQLDGRVQLEGQGHGGLLLGGVIEGFRAAARQRGAARRLARKMGR
jgi:putative sterol carrier protein